MKKAKQILAILGIDTFTAVKKHYNALAGNKDFYPMLKRRLKEKPAKELAYFLRHELHYHYKEFAQYQ